jgi:hypothetical protein
LDDVRKRYLKELIKKDNKSIYLIGITIQESIFPRINTTKSSKQAWNILNNTYEGLAVAKLQTLRRKFKNYKMNSNESVNEYITKIHYIVNEMRILGEYILERRILENILRSIMSKFEMVSTSIVVSKDLSTMRIDELSGYLLIVE